MYIKNIELEDSELTILPKFEALYPTLIDPKKVIFYDNFIGEIEIISGKSPALTPFDGKWASSNMYKSENGLYSESTGNVRCAVLYKKTGSATMTFVINKEEEGFVSLVFKASDSSLSLYNDVSFRATDGGSLTIRAGGQTANFPVEIQTGIVYSVRVDFTETSSTLWFDDKVITTTAISADSALSSYLGLRISKQAGSIIDLVAK